MPKGKGNAIAQNKKASHDYFIEDTIEAGLVLDGTEIKSIRKGKVQLKDSYIQIRNGEAWVSNMHISPYEQGNIFNIKSTAASSLLLHKRQIQQLNYDIKRDGYTIVPLKMYIKDGYAKLLIGLGKGKKNYDKRQDLKKKDAKRDMARAMKDRAR